MHGVCQFLGLKSKSEYCSSEAVVTLFYVKEQSLDVKISYNHASCNVFMLHLYQFEFGCIGPLNVV